MTRFGQLLNRTGSQPRKSEAVLKFFVDFGVSDAKISSMRKKCKICRQKLPPGRRRYCSVDCQDEGRRKRQRILRPPGRKCAHCRKPFRPRRQGNRYCSPKCRQAAFMGRLRDPMRHVKQLGAQFLKRETAVIANPFGEQIYQEGRNAALDGRSAGDNPYPSGSSSHEIWARGFVWRGTKEIEQIDKDFGKHFGK
jgi:hypothetical protein